MVRYTFLVCMESIVVSRKTLDLTQFGLSPTLNFPFSVDYPSVTQWLSFTMQAAEGGCPLAGWYQPVWMAAASWPFWIVAAQSPWSVPSCCLSYKWYALPLSPVSTGTLNTSRWGGAWARCIRCWSPRWPTSHTLCCWSRSMCITRYSLDPGFAPACPAGARSQECPFLV